MNKQVTTAIARGYIRHDKRVNFDYLVNVNAIRNNMTLKEMLDILIEYESKL